MKHPLLSRIRVNPAFECTDLDRTIGQWVRTACATGQTRPDLFREVREPESVERTVRVAAHPAVGAQSPRCAVAAECGMRPLRAWCCRGSTWAGISRNRKV